MRVNISAISLGEMSYDNRLDDYTPVQGAGLKTRWKRSCHQVQSRLYVLDIEKHY